MLHAYCTQAQDRRWPYVGGTLVAEVLDTWRLMLTALKRKIADDPYVGGTLLA